MFELIPVVETHPRQPFEWASPEPSGPLIELNAATPERDIAWVFALLADYNYVLAPASIDAAVHALLETDGMALSGGLLVRSGKVEIPPSCCCGLEDWREWFIVSPGAGSPYLGHDPSPFVECAKAAATIWADEDRPAPSVSATYPEIDTARQSARTALMAFADNLANWLASYSSQSTEFMQRFRSDFGIR